MNIYFWIVRLGALFGHRKAKALVRGQKHALSHAQQWCDTLNGHKVIWIHVASVGEFEQVRPIIERLREEQPTRKILLTFFSPSEQPANKHTASKHKISFFILTKNFDLACQRYGFRL